MHDPMVLLYDFKQLGLDVWHVEPGGHDSAEVCGHAPHGWRRATWTARHVRHLHFRFWPVFKVRRWLRDRCGECGRRFLWRDERHGYQSSDTVYHAQCMSLRACRSQLDDLTAYVLATADSNARWRAERRLKHLEEVTP